MLDVVAGPGVVRLGHFLRAIVPNGGEVYKFKEWAQLWGCRPDGTFVPMLSHKVRLSTLYEDDLGTSFV